MNRLEPDEDFRVRILEELRKQGAELPGGLSNLQLAAMIAITSELDEIGRVVGLTRIDNRWAFAEPAGTA